MKEKNKTVQLLVRLDRLLHRYYGHLRMGKHGDLHRGQGRVLSLLKLQPEISQKELAFLLDMRKQSLSELLTKLESKGLITRQPSQEDRRVMNITLTQAGAEAAANMDEERQEQSDIFDTLDEQEKRQLEDYLTRLIDRLERELASLPESEMPPFQRDLEDFPHGHFHSREHSHERGGPHPGCDRQSDFPHGRQSRKQAGDWEQDAHTGEPEEK